MKTIEMIAEGAIWKEPDGSGYGPKNARVALLPNGTLLASVIFTLGGGRGIQRTYTLRSRDLGRSWENLGPIFDWPRGEAGRFERVNFSRSRNGHVLGLGMGWEIPAPGVRYYDPDTGRTLDTDLFFITSADEGETWSEAKTFALAYPEPPECGGVICEVRSGAWLAPYAPWLDRNSRNANQGKAAVTISTDRGESWRTHAQVLQGPANWAFQEVWTEELSNGNVLTTSWVRDMAAAKNLDLYYSLSDDGGLTWSSTVSTGLSGGPMATRALANGRAACIWAKRECEEPGLAFAIAKPDIGSFNLEFQTLVWRTGSGTRDLGYDKKELYWMDASFGEPAIETFPDGSFFAVFWYQDRDGSQTRFCHFRVA
jgi:hypothetical protein